MFFLGGAQTDFARNATREGVGAEGLVREAVLGALAAAHLTADAIEAIHVGNAFGELFTGQAQMGALPATVVPELWGVPASRHEGACASGSLAILAATAAIEAGRCDVALVVGVEIERNVPGEVAARHLGAAAWAGREEVEARYLWPSAFSRLGDEIERRHGLRHEHLAAIAQKNFANARLNPNAQTRGWRFDPASFGEDDSLNPVIEGRLRRQDCSQVTDGAVALVLASARFAAAHARRTGRGLDAMARLLGWGHRTAALSLDAKLQRSQGGPYLLPDLRRSITDAFARAGLAGVDDIDGIETHDCFSVSEYIAIDHFGITPPGQAFRAIEDGSTRRDGRIPVNPGGGLIGAGHPVGATGVRMALDACLQVTGAAGAMQLDGARRIACLNLGGSATTTCALLWGRA